MEHLDLDGAAGMREGRPGTCHTSEVPGFSRQHRMHKGSTTQRRTRVAIQVGLPALNLGMWLGGTSGNPKKWVRLRMAGLHLVLKVAHGVPNQNANTTPCEI